ncbi:uncharacterized protein BDR25DRAFT_360038 [Lindgomyces ingoldianus]|uniref:Uncharacterized protein n=1 Tax=Lindgomyces ingoldianus TaxID=673940 RepID=A0ACB6QIA8_9PLEO|nr:uncharacterized protein BDR25DRAFT_360038 [Lindgomyces ingoldianus]KAF2465875.1 hypothetical protein BDR25DRAFT_360038 [Lindgomyces ingoldianus]
MSPLVCWCMAGVSRNHIGGIFVSLSSLEQEVIPHVFAPALYLAYNKFQHLCLNVNFLLGQKMVREKNPKSISGFLKLWEVHCQGHVDNLENFPVFLDPLVFNGVLAMPGFCYNCLTNPGLPASTRMYQFKTKLKWQSHIQTHASFNFTFRTPMKRPRNELNEGYSIQPNKKRIILQNRAEDQPSLLENIFINSIISSMEAASNSTSKSSSANYPLIAAQLLVVADMTAVFDTAVIYMNRNKPSFVLLKEQRSSLVEPQRRGMKNRKKLVSIMASSYAWRNQDVA